MNLSEILRVNAEDYLLAGRLIEQLAAEHESQRTVFMDEDAARYYGDELRQLRSTLVELHLDTSVVLLDETIQKVSGHVSWETVSTEINLLHRAMEAELTSKAFLFVPSPRAEFFEEFEGAPFDVPFGHDGADKFPSATPDIREARRCIAFGRDTACVFHLMRVLERGLAALASKFSVSFAYENWKNVLDQIEKQIPALERPCPRVRPSRVRLFKDAWRNHVMHGRGVYEFQAAKKLRGHVGDFMRHLATKLQESK